MRRDRRLKPLGIAQIEAARRLDISLNRLNEIVLGKRGISADRGESSTQSHEPGDRPNGVQCPLDVRCGAWTGVVP